MKAEKKNGNGFGLTLGMAASLAPWPTPKNSNNENRQSEGYGGITGNIGSLLGTWQTPKAHDGEWSSPRTSGRPVEKSTHLQTQVGAVLNGSPAPTEKRGQLNPAFSLWLMGFPPQWMALAPSRESARSVEQVTPSCPK